jgi:nucleotide-binding universal stress UspA family protein
MLERVMIALDGSPLAEQALPFAAAVAKAFEAEVILLRVVETSGGPSTASLDSVDWRLGRLEAIDYLSDIERQLEGAGVTVDIDVTAGRASDEILEMARARDVDLIVLGSHGTGGLTQYRMASTAQKVIFGSETSVLVVPGTEEGVEAPAFTSVLVPVDGSPHSDWAVSVSARLARSQGAPLVLVHVVRTPALLDPQGTAREAELIDELVTLNRRAASRYLDGVKRRLECPGGEIRSCIEVSNEIAPVVERHARAEGRPLVVMSARGALRYEDVPYGSLVTILLTNAEQPVLVLREPTPKERSGGNRRAGEAVQPQRRATIPYR